MFIREKLRELPFYWVSSMCSDWVTICYWGKSILAFEKVTILAILILLHKNPSSKVFSHRGLVVSWWSNYIPCWLGVWLSSSSSYPQKLTKCLAHSRESIYYGWWNGKKIKCLFLDVNPCILKVTMGRDLNEAGEPRTQEILFLCGQNVHRLSPA